MASDNLDRDLPWFKRLSLKVHLLICKACDLSSKQLSFIGKAANQYENHCEKEHCLCQEAKDRMQEKIAQASVKES